MLLLWRIGAFKLIRFHLIGLEGIWMLRLSFKVFWSGEELGRCLVDLEFMLQLLPLHLERDVLGTCESHLLRFQRTVVELDFLLLEAHVVVPWKVSDCVNFYVTGFIRGLEAVQSLILLCCFEDGVRASILFFTASISVFFIWKLYITVLQTSLL